MFLRLSCFSKNITFIRSLQTLKQTTNINLLTITNTSSSLPPSLPLSSLSSLNSLNSSSSSFLLSSKRYYSNKPSNSNSNNKHNNNDNNNNKLFSNNSSGLIGSLFVGGSILFSKTKYLLLALKITKLSSIASLLLSSVAYGYIFGWPYGLGMVGLIFVHETGHALAMHYHKIPFSPMVFIPFLGASVGMEEYPANASIEAQVAIAGPILGSLAALGLGFAGDVTNSQILLALANWGYMINLFNLLPIGTLDGGRILGAISPVFGIVGVGAGVGLIYNGIITNPLMYLIVLGGAYQSFSKLVGWSTPQLPPNYYNLKRTTQAGIFGSYLALVAALLFAMNENNKKRKSPAQLKREQNWDSRGEESFDEWYQRDQQSRKGLNQIEEWQRVIGDDSDESF